MTVGGPAPQALPGLVVLAGPTASGKSDLAVRLALACRGTIVNADSMQLYRDLRVLTARPSAADEARVPHLLFGVLEASAPGSAGDWLGLAESALETAREQRRIPIVVGGTGLYLRALLDGIAPTPPIPEAVRRESRALFARLGRAGLRDRLLALDPEADRGPGLLDDPQRLMRAYEVVRASGRPLRAWQADPPQRIALPGPVRCVALLPPRAELYARIGQRLRAMIAAGALDEVRGLAARRLDPALPLMKAVAVQDLLAHLAGQVDLETAVDRATVRTRRYAKRQTTWLRHRMPEFELIPDFGEAVPVTRLLDVGRVDRSRPRP